MIELLIQAEDAVAGGQLDQGERIYWQLVESDPHNAMALAGLARVALDRGDLATARQLTGAALSLDPDGIAAKRVAAALDAAGAPGLPDAQAPDLARLAGERLAALGRRPPKDGQTDTETATRADAVAVTRPEPRRVASARQAAARVADPFAAAEAAAAIEAIDAVDNLEVESAPVEAQGGGVAALDAAVTDGAANGAVDGDVAVAQAPEAGSPDADSPEAAAPDADARDADSPEAAPDAGAPAAAAGRGETPEARDRGADIRWESAAGAASEGASPAGAAQGEPSRAPAQDGADPDAGRRSRLLRRFLGR